MIVGTIVHMNYPNPAQWIWYDEETDLPFPKDAIPVSGTQDPAVVACFHTYFPEYFIPGLD